MVDRFKMTCPSGKFSEKTYLIENMDVAAGMLMSKEDIFKVSDHLAKEIKSKGDGSELDFMTGYVIAQDPSKLTISSTGDVELADDVLAELTWGNLGGRKTFGGRQCSSKHEFVMAMKKARHGVKYRGMEELHLVIQDTVKQMVEMTSGLKTFRLSASQENIEFKLKEWECKVKNGKTSKVIDLYNPSTGSMVSVSSDTILETKCARVFFNHGSDTVTVSRMSDFERVLKLMKSLSGEMIDSVSIMVRDMSAQQERKDREMIERGIKALESLVPVEYGVSREIERKDIPKAAKMA